MKKLVFLIVLSSLASTHLVGQDLTPRSSFQINIDYARFRNNEQSGYLEIYYGFYPSLLTYRRSEGKYRAGVQLRTLLRNDKTNVLELNERVTLPLAITDTSDVSYRYPFITQAGYAFPLGDYTLEVVAADSMDPSCRDSLSLKMTIGAYPSGVQCSDLELCSNVKSSRKKDDPFFKNSLEVVPNPTLIFGVTAYPVLFDYLELYNLNPEETYEVKRVILDTEGKISRESSKMRKYGVRDAVEVGTTNVTSIASGKYHFRLSLFDQASQELAQTEKTFFIYNPHLKAPSATVVSFQASELDGLSEKELTNDFERARYIATDDEIRLFKQLDSEEGKREFLVKFWTDVEKGRFGRPPIQRVDYLRLVEITDEQYSRMGITGWKSDRGRVYILYGKPDEIERHPHVSESKPNEIWHYYGIEGGVQFVFIDRFGFGDYELVHSTKRGELRDDQWERFLR